LTLSRVPQSGGWDRVQRPPGAQQAQHGDNDGSAGDDPEGAASGTMGPVNVTAILLCGGGSTRFGADKTRQPLGDSTVLDHLLDSLVPGWGVVAVGPPRPLRREVTWAREVPPGGGPLAGISAGMRHVSTDLVVVLAGDMPFAGTTATQLVATLVADADAVTDAVTAVDGDGRTNPLLTAYRSEALRRAQPRDPAGPPARLLLQTIRHTTLAVPDEQSLDVDTPEALERARHRLDP